MRFENDHPHPDGPTLQPVPSLEPGRSGSTAGITAGKTKVAGKVATALGTVAAAAAGFVVGLPPSTASALTVHNRFIPPATIPAPGSAGLSYHHLSRIDVEFVSALVVVLLGLVLILASRRQRNHASLVAAADIEEPTLSRLTSVAQQSGDAGDEALDAEYARTSAAVAWGTAKHTGPQGSFPQGGSWLDESGSWHSPSGIPSTGILVPEGWYSLDGDMTVQTYWDGGSWVSRIHWDGAAWQQVA